VQPPFPANPVASALQPAPQPAPKPLPHAQAASRAEVVVDMQLPDIDRTTFGIPSGAVTEVNAPPNPFAQAVDFDKAGKHKEAERIYLELLNEFFDNAVLHAALGMNYCVGQKSGLAHRLLQFAADHADQLESDFDVLGIGIDPSAIASRETFFTLKRSEILNALGTCYKNENRTEEARDYFNRAQALVPPNADIQNNLGTLLINEGSPAEALAIFDHSIALKPDHAQAHWNRSLAYLELGQWAEGWPEYKWGIRANVRGDRNYNPPNHPPLAHWDGTRGKKLVVYGEQGIGDELLFFSCLPELLADNELVVVDCHKKLHRLLANSFPNTLFYPTREDDIIHWGALPDGTPRYQFDAKLASGCLPRHYRMTDAAFPGTPFLRATPDASARWKDKLAALPRRPNVGISWIGGHKRTRREVRSIPLAQLEPILRAPVNWISLQYTPCEAEIADFHHKTGITIHHWPEAVATDDYNDTAGLVANLDLVITVATSVLHLAGGLGVPAWVLTASRAAWREYVTGAWDESGRWHTGEGAGNPWYKSLTMFRQPHGTVDWNPVIEEVATALADITPTQEA
jgi:tetratricopeptide (TPR) repeat protein